MAIGLYQWHRYLTTPIAITETANPQPLVFFVKPGTSFKQLSNNLATKGWLTQPYYFYWYGRLSGKADQVKAGEYQLDNGTNPRQLLDKLISGKVVVHQVTLVDGYTFKQFLAVLAEQPLLQHQLAGLTDQQIMVKLDLPPNQNPEGLFFPDTYRYVAGMSDVALLKQAYQKMQQVLGQQWVERAPDLPYKDPYQALIMASIIEKETAVPEEREIIAGVFVSRLRKNMYLQTDPTVIYGLGDQYQGRLTRPLLNMDTPYNTYRHKGLTPTPIAMPGEAAIKAALHPEFKGYLYFVAKGNGHHQFSKTLAEHNKAVRRYQLKRAKDYRSTPVNRSS
jgi:UPF0755 protein